MKPEDQLQVSVMRYIALAHPTVYAIHVANERRTSPQAGALLKLKGVKAGVPDILIFKPRICYNGLAIELKIGRNKPTPAQLESLKALEAANWKTAVCYTFNEAIDAINFYLT